MGRTSNSTENLSTFCTISIILRNEVYPDYVNHTYELDYDSNRSVEVKYSESFFIYGQEWRLKIYPTGNGQAPGHLSLFLELLNVKKIICRLQIALSTPLLACSISFGWS